LLISCSLAKLSLTMLTSLVAGTPNIVGIWRLGLVWQFKQRLKRMLHSDHNLVDSEIKRGREIQERLKQIPNLMLLDGHLDSPKVPVFSFLIKCGNRFLHYNYVCALLNDVFGIQCRGGCQCAGPYAQMMLGMLKHNQEVEHWLVHSKDELLRPGVTRFSLPAIGTTPEQQEYVLKAIEWVAKNGWKFMHVYRCNQRTGEWRHKSRPGAPLGKKERRWLSHYDPMNN
jgi:selenocysteine lyase/cysteine desulfurase